MLKRVGRWVNVKPRGRLLPFSFWIMGRHQVSWGEARAAMGDLTLG